MKKILAILLAALTLLTLPLTLASCGGGGACEYAKTRDITGRDISYVEISVKGYGKMVVLLDATTAPVTVENFLSLVNAGFYDGLYIHRVIGDFMIQGGDPKGNGSGGSDKEIVGEFSSNGHANDISHLKGVISMARGEENDSASSQFFICNADAKSLDGNYAAFGYVVEGLSVVDDITEAVFPKTAYYDYYKQYVDDPTEQNYYYYYLWQNYGNGAISSNADKPVIEYIRVLDDYS